MNRYQRVFEFGRPLSDDECTDHHFVPSTASVSNAIAELRKYVDSRRRRLDQTRSFTVRPDCVFVICSPILQAYNWFFASEVDSARLERLCHQLTYSSLLRIDSCYFVNDGSRLIDLLSIIFRSTKVFRYFFQLTPDQYEILRDVCMNYAYRRKGDRSLVDKVVTTAESTTTTPIESSSSSSSPLQRSTSTSPATTSD